MFRKIVLENSSDKRTLALKTVLDIEKIPYVTYDKVKKEDYKEALFLCTASLPQGKHQIIFNPELLTGEKESFREEIRLSLKDNSVNALLKEFRLQEKASLPLKTIFKKELKGKILANGHYSNKEFPLVIKEKTKVYFLFDILPLFLDLISETYFEKKQEKHLLSNDLSDWLYKKIPYPIKMAMYRSYYRKLHRGLAKQQGFRTNYPIDAAGFLLLELVKHSLLELTEILKIGRWPNPYHSATLITHDTEPTQYSYTQGLPQLLNALEKSNYQSTITLVGKYVKYIPQETRKRLQKHELGCHDLLHDRKFLLISSAERKQRLIRGKFLIEQALQKEVKFFRAPALQRPQDLLSLLEDTGYCYDSSLIDSQREEPYCGKGNSFFLPFYPVVNGKQSPVLELTVTAPDCISPYFFGYSMKTTLATFKKKVSWIEKVGGLGVYITHTPAWNKTEAKKRLLLLESLIHNTKASWNTTITTVTSWWQMRNQLELAFENKSLKITNKNKEEMNDIVVEIQSKENVKKILLPRLKAGESFKIPTQNL